MCCGLSEGEPTPESPPRRGFKIGNKKGGYGMKNKEEFKKLYGWDDGKIYFMDEERKKEWCVTDEKELYN